jgi:acyl dehydratase
MGDRYFEDFKVGERLESSSLKLGEAEIVAFAREYDPQPFHIDSEAAKRSAFGRLVASGWQTTAISMRLIVESGVFGTRGGVGLGVDELRWLKPVYPGDTLRVVSEVESTRANPEKPSGICRFKITTLNQDDVPVMRHVAIVLVPKRPAAAGA